eukprot:TRINITY_DN15267_c0_g1_i9.p1 TRINITY_DN15267_c0_g1~~TRINITY_DN15267_c0_g1_i9.p1  ORF type:complete len:425 (-),score=110.36 TRINITY_DN15267_c0_g1_i9:981-2255(-)
MALNAYLKDWESLSAISRTQAELIGDIQRLTEASTHPRALPQERKQPEEVKLNDKLAEHEGELKDLLGAMGECREYLEELKGHHSELMAKTSEFQSKCGSILKEQKTLADIAGELSRSLEYYKEVDLLLRSVYKKDREILAPDANFPKLLATLEEAESFFYKNTDYLDSKEYITKIYNVKLKVSEIIESYIQHATADQYIQRLTNDDLTEKNVEEYKSFLYSPIEALDVIGVSFNAFQQFAVERSIQGYLQVTESIASDLFSLRKGFISKLCDYLIRDALKSENLFAVTKSLLQIQAAMTKDELSFFKRYFLQLNAIEHEVSQHFESSMYNYLRPLIIKESNIKELSSAIVFAKKVFFEQSRILTETKGISQKFITKVKQPQSVDHARHAGKTHLPACQLHWREAEEAGDKCCRSEGNCCPLPR